MSEIELRTLFDRYILVLNSHQFLRLSEFIHDQIVVNGQSTTRDELISVLEGHVDAVPDLAWRPRDIAIDGNQVAARFSNRGTPVKDWLGSAPNGATVEYVEHVFHKVRAGRFHELHFLLDTAAVQMQLAS